ncbi:glutamyl-tRNA reductase [Caldisphaera lagunensis DSM 15908]|uniref:Glutamyl-tRNA reductase n=1 Tax=Caldisphaera lagunensis (strain DSM 15908 / JCM 11604 / ANMR 0165 / IC-154) TaxID=1056495 RepID=L0A9Q6_CALLD|nr:NAD(P)-binding domain-containing protein [Caldisphaera lagunensis]AFZ70144.1 glutamyl-tRNA reductase [Caldisphaera lagunensis DSM 15908]
MIDQTYNINNLKLYSITYKDSCFYDMEKIDELKERIYDDIFHISNGIIILSTCNRFEIYVDSYNDILEEEINKNMGIYSKFFHKYSGLESAEHLFRVSAGLESSILGETEILSQVKDAWEEAKNLGYTSKLLDSVFHQSIIVGKRVRSETDISKGVLGFPQASVELASKLLGTLDNKEIAIIGAGNAAKIMVDHICSKWNPSKITIANRTLEKAKMIINNKCNFEINTLNEIANKKFDAVLIAIKGGPFDFLNNLLNKNDVIIDISTPSAIMNDNTIYNIESVDKLVKENFNHRLDQVQLAEKIIKEELDKLIEYLKKRSIDENISEIMRYIDLIIKYEMEQTKKNINKGMDLDEALKIAFESFAKKSMKPIFNLLHDTYNENISELIIQYYKKNMR